MDHLPRHRNRHQDRSTRSACGAPGPHRRTTPAHPASADGHRTFAARPGDVLRAARPGHAPRRTHQGHRPLPRLP
ncbi:hypothetical protein D3105_25425, partial [Streptomyces globisporus]